MYGRARRQVYAVLPAATLVMVRRAETRARARRADTPPPPRRPIPSLLPVPSSHREREEKGRARRRRRGRGGQGQGQGQAERERRGTGAESGPPRRAPGLRPIRDFVFSCCGSQVACSRPSDYLSRVKAILFILRIPGFIFTFRFRLNRFKVLDSAASDTLFRIKQFLFYFLKHSFYFAAPSNKIFLFYLLFIFTHF